MLQSAWTGNIMAFKLISNDDSPLGAARVDAAYSYLHKHIFNDWKCIKKETNLMDSVGPTCIFFILKELIY